MPGLPTMQVLLDDGTGTFPYDISSKVRKIDPKSFTRGRGDEQSAVTTGTMGLALNNADGRFTPGSTIIASPSPIKLDQRIRIKETLPSTDQINLLSAADADFESGLGAWVAAGTVLPVLSNPSFFVASGTKSMLITWQGSGSNPQAQIQPSGFTIGQTYTFAVWVRVPAGSPDVRCGAGATVSALTSVKDAPVRLQVTFVAASTTPTFFIRSSGAPAGSQCYVDAAMVVAGSTIGDFNTVAPVTYTRFTGYVKSWNVGWPAAVASHSVVQIAASDAQERAGRRTLRSVVAEDIKAGAPTAPYYPLGEPEGAIAAGDVSGTQDPPLTMTGTGAAVVFGAATGPVGGGSSATAAQFNGGQYLTRSFAGPGTPSPLGIVFSRNGLPASAETLFAGFGCELVVETSGKLSVYRLGSLELQTSGSVCDNAFHVAKIAGWTGAGSFAVDDVSIGSWSSLGVGLTFPTDVGIGGGTRTTFTGILADVVFGGAPAYQAVATGFAGESGTARITRLDGYAGIPIGTLDTSLTNVPFVDLAGVAEQDAVQQVADAEMGVVFIDGSGNRTFHNRNRVPLKTTPDLTLAATYVSFDTENTTDDVEILNLLDVTSIATGVTQTVHDTTSDNSHGTYPDSKDYLVQTNAEALDRGNWIITARKEPGPRYGTLVLNLYKMDWATAQAVIAAVEADCWLRVTGMPAQNTGGTTADVIVQGFTEEQTDKSWTLSCNVEDKATVYPSAWILGDATYGVLGSTTRLYV